MFLRCGIHILAKVRFTKYPRLGENHLRVPEKTFFKLLWTSSSSDWIQECWNVH